MKQFSKTWPLAPALAALGIAVIASVGYAGFSSLGSAMPTPAFNGAIVNLTADLTGVDASDASEYNVTWTSEIHDPDGWHSTSSNTDLLVVPAKYHGAYAIFGATVKLEALTADEWYAIQINQLDVDGTTNERLVRKTIESGLTDDSSSVVTNPILLSAGDSFWVRLNMQTDTSITIAPDVNGTDSSNFWVQVLDR